MKGTFASSFLFLEERLGVADVLEGGFLVLRVGVPLDLTGTLSGALTLGARVGVPDVLSGTFLVARVGMVFFGDDGLSGAFFVTRVGVRLGTAGFLVLRVGVRLDLTGTLSGAAPLVARVGNRLGAPDVLSGTFLVTRVGVRPRVVVTLSRGFLVGRVGMPLIVADGLSGDFLVLRVGARTVERVVRTRPLGEGTFRVGAVATDVRTRGGERFGGKDLVKGLRVLRVGKRVPPRVGRGFEVSRKGTAAVERRKFDDVFEIVFLVDLSGAGTFRLGAVTVDGRVGRGERLGADTDRSGGFRVLRVGARSLERDGRVGTGLLVPLRTGSVTVARDGVRSVFEIVFLVDLSGAGTFRLGAVTVDGRVRGGERLGADTDRSGGFRVLRVGVRPLERGGTDLLVPRRGSRVTVAREGGGAVFEALVRRNLSGAGTFRFGEGERLGAEALSGGFFVLRSGAGKLERAGIDFVVPLRGRLVTLARDGGATMDAVVLFDLSGAGTFRVGAVAAGGRSGGGERLGAADLGDDFLVVRVGIPLGRSFGLVVPRRGGAVTFTRDGAGPKFIGVVRRMRSGDGVFRPGVGLGKRCNAHLLAVMLTRATGLNLKPALPYSPYVLPHHGKRRFSSVWPSCVNV